MWMQGIETVRRDGCPALVKMMERSLRILFTGRDLSEVRYSGAVKVRSYISFQ